MNARKKFERKWNFPSCLGAAGTKHVKIIPPETSQSFYYMFQAFGAEYLISLKSVNYNFIQSDIGYGSVADE
jgi:hypothetical protein